MTIDLGVDYLVDVTLIGQGGFGSVYAATDRRFDRKVAVKVLSRALSEKDRLSFERECKLMGRMSTHPNVVTVHEAGFSADNHPFLVMELVEGGTLTDRLEQFGPIPWAKAVDYVIPVADALGAGHAQGIEHRDVKPDNILLDGDEPRLTDFGIARLRDAAGATSTHITASWLHAPPETFENQRDNRSDIYSLVSTLHTLITGEAPFWDADDESLSPLMFRLISQAPPMLPPELGPPALANLLQTGLAKDPAQRPQTTDELITQLRYVTQEQPATISATPAVGVPSLGAPQTIVAETPPPVEANPFASAATGGPPILSATPAASTHTDLAATDQSQVRHFAPAHIETRSRPSRGVLVAIGLVSALAILIPLALALGNRTNSATTTTTSTATTSTSEPSTTAETVAPSSTTSGLSTTTTTTPTTTSTTTRSPQTTASRSATTSRSTTTRRQTTPSTASTTNPTSDTTATSTEPDTTAPTSEPPPTDPPPTDPPTSATPTTEPPTSSSETTSSTDSGGGDG